MIRVAIVDLGVGIESALRENPANDEILADTPPLLAAIHSKVTGRPGFNSGLGLFWSSKIIEANEGRLGIHSGSQRLDQTASVTVSDSSWWPGTVVHLKFNTNRPLNHAAIFDRYAPEENDFAFLDENQSA